MSWIVVRMDALEQQLATVIAEVERLKEERESATTPAINAPVLHADVRQRGRPRKSVDG